MTSVAFLGTGCTITPHAGQRSYGKVGNVSFPTFPHTGKSTWESSERVVRYFPTPAVESFKTTRAPLVHLNNARSQPSGANAYPFFEPFAEPPTPAPQAVVQNQINPSPPSNLPQPLYNSPLPRRVDHLVCSQWTGD
jgi:hypothetical protein